MAERKLTSTNYRNQSFLEEKCTLNELLDLISKRWICEVLFAIEEGHSRFKNIREELKQTFLERSDLIDGALGALLSSHHLLIIGPPGTAKSMLADELCRRIDGANYFQWLLTRAG